MDPTTFQSFKQQITKESFSNGKIGVVTSFSQKHYFSGPQVSETIKLFPFNSDQLKVLDILAPRMTPLSGEDGKNIVLCFAHAHDRLVAVETIAKYINDPVNKYAVLDAISFHFDKEKARQILDQAVSVAVSPCPPTCTSAPPCQYTTAPTGQPGGPPPSGQYQQQGQYPSVQNPAYPPGPWQASGQPPQPTVQYPQASGQYPQVPGQYPQAPSQYPQAPSQYPQAPSQYPQAPGQYPQAPGQYSQAPGQYPQAPPGQYSQAPGQYPQAPGQYSQAPSQYPQAPGQYSQASGQYPPGGYPPPPGQYPPGQYPPPPGQYPPGQYPPPPGQYPPGQYPQVPGQYPQGYR